MLLSKFSFLPFQGTIVDRIDNNIENAHIKVSEGLEQLKKAEKYQAKNRKLKCIAIEAVIVVCMIVIWFIKISL